MADEPSKLDEDGVKITDRRSFTSSDERRDETSTEPDGGSGSDPDEPANDSDLAPPSIDFVAFVQSLYLSALMALGEVQNPETRLVTTNLDIARQDIDILAMLLDKTRGNLTPSEDTFLQQVVPQLQLLYVKKAR